MKPDEMRSPDPTPSGPRRAGAAPWPPIALALALAGCVPGGQADDRPEPADGALPDGALPDPGLAVWDALDDCAMTGRFRPAPLAFDADDCARRLIPRADVLLVERGPGGPRLRVGALDLALAEGAAECTFTARGCAVDGDLGSSTTVDGILRATEAGVAFDFTPEQITDFDLRTCGPTHLEATPQPTDACGFNGRFTVQEAPALVAGQCDLGWSPATIDVVFEDGAGTVKWGQKLYDEVAFDPEACRFEISGGNVIYNGAVRTTRIVASATAVGLSITIDDALDGADMLGNTCVDARFEAEAPRAEPPMTTPFADRCDPLPRVCGDGVCAADAGESCARCQSDCGCEDGIQCAPLVDETWECIEPCTTDADCPAGEQCEPQPGSSSICLRSTGEAGVSDGCERTRDCAAGLQCISGQCRAACEGPGDRACPWCESVRGQFWCVPPCDTAEGRCPEALYCATDAGWICSDDRPAGAGICDPLPRSPRCRATPETAPEFGAPCDERACRSGLVCIGAGCDGQTCAETLCSAECNGDADCADPLPVCDRARVFGFGFCVAERP